MIVLDASAVIELLLRTPTGARIAGRIAAPEESLHAPCVLDLEVVQVLRRYTTAGAITAAEAEQALRDLAELDINRYEHEPFVPRIWQLRHNLTAYDACYVALSEALEAPLLTCDNRIRLAPGHEATVEVF
ncbi:MAG: PIN domain-containing protein [Deltaproteobacteria bacterium]|nr:MAG: PIN domain-containing protein [Deltaproteobacteria bacterium]